LKPPDEETTHGVSFLGSGVVDVQLRSRWERGRLWPGGPFTLADDDIGVIVSVSCPVR
jgi:hypothetical protein